MKAKPFSSAEGGAPKQDDRRPMKRKYILPRMLESPGSLEFEFHCIQSPVTRKNGRFIHVCFKSTAKIALEVGYVTRSFESIFFILYIYLGRLVTLSNGKPLSIFETLTASDVAETLSSLRALHVLLMYKFSENRMNSRFA